MIFFPPLVLRVRRRFFWRPRERTESALPLHDTSQTCAQTPVKRTDNTSQTARAARAARAAQALAARCGPVRCDRGCDRGRRLAVKYSPVFPASFLQLALRSVRATVA